MPPPQRLILRPTDLSRLRIDVALKLRRRAAPQIRMQLLALSRRLDSNRLFGPGIRSRRLVDPRLRLGRGGGCRGGGVGGGGGGFGCAEGACARFLQLLEYLLLFFWEARGRGGSFEGRGGTVAGGGAEGAAGKSASGEEAGEGDGRTHC